jgi:hypothetical protein
VIDEARFDGGIGLPSFMAVLLENVGRGDRRHLSQQQIGSIPNEP